MYRIPRLLGKQPASVRTIRRLLDKEVRIIALKPNKDLDRIDELFATGGMITVIDGPYPLAETPAAIQRFGEARHLGKVVIQLVA